MEKCICGSGIDAGKCCKQYLDGKEIPKTAEAMMRSRYYAYTVQNIDYIMATHDPDTVKHVKREVLGDWSKSSKWISLEILSKEKGEAGDSEGNVEFVAVYEVDGERQRHHEKSLFLKKEGKWYYNSKLPVNETIINNDKIGRNDPCPCGSGKKYKKCCGK